MGVANSSLQTFTAVVATGIANAKKVLIEGRT